MFPIALRTHLYSSYSSSSFKPSCLFMPFYPSIYSHFTFSSTFYFFFSSIYTASPPLPSPLPLYPPSSIVSRDPCIIGANSDRSFSHTLHHLYPELISYSRRCPRPVNVVSTRRRQNATCVIHGPRRQRQVPAARADGRPDPSSRGRSEEEEQTTRAVIITNGNWFQLYLMQLSLRRR